MYSLLTLTITIVVGVCASQEQQGKRTVALRNGPLITSRNLASDYRLPLRGRLAEQSKETYLWVLALPIESQQAVGSSLDSPNSNVLHALPGQNHAWLVNADLDSMQRVLDAHEDVSVALLPPSHKLSPAVTQLIAAHQRGILRASGHLPHELSFLQHKVTPGGQVQVTLLALTAGVPQDHIKPMAAQIQTQLRQLLKTTSNNEQLTVMSSGQYLHVLLFPKDVDVVAMWLASRQDVTWVELQPQFVLHDLHSIATIQAPGVLPSVSYPAPDVSNSDLYHPLWKAGLDGKGQVVGVVDSGLDLDSCYLWDPAQNDYMSGPNTRYTALEFDNNIINVGVYKNNATRKVAGYVFLGDSRDDLEAHGTHVTTSLVGSMYGFDPITQPDYAVGVAPNGKVAIVDIGTNDTFQFVGIAADTIYGQLKEAGAAITSNSWGFNGSYDYTSYFCQVMDYHAYRNPDMLHVFSAGNDGYEQPLGFPNGTVSAPATCKNILSVGAADNYIYRHGVIIDMLDNTGKQVQLPSGQFLGNRQRGTLNFQDDQGLPLALVNGQRDGFAYIDGVDPRLNLLQSQPRQVFLSQPSDACAPLDPAFLNTIPANSPAAILIEISSCSAQALSSIFADKRIAAAFFYDPNPTTARYIADAQDPGIGTTSIIYSKRTISAVVNYLRSGGTLQVSWTPPNGSDPAPTENVSGFSSWGSPYAFGPDPPSLWARIKPDIIAPGFIQAGISDGQFSGQMDQCSTAVKQGTSMATPQVSGGALLVRQYFMDGFYPTGARVPANGFTPSGSLIRAVLTAGTIAMKGLSQLDFQTLQPPPSQFQGFGRMALSNSLPLAGDADSRRITVVEESLELGYIGTLDVIIEPAYAGRPLVVVLAFHDLPAYPGASQSAVNDLDLSVTGPDGMVYYPNGRSGPDPVNNVEKIYIPAAAAGNYTLKVRATYVWENVKVQPLSMAILWSGAPEPSDASPPPSTLLLSPPPQAAAPPPLSPQSGLPPPSDASKFPPSEGLKQPQMPSPAAPPPFPLTTQLPTTPPTPSAYTPIPPASPSAPLPPPSLPAPPPSPPQPPLSFPPLARSINSTSSSAPRRIQPAILLQCISACLATGLGLMLLH